MNALPASRDPRTRAFAAFATVALIVFGVDGAIARSGVFLERPDIFAPAVTIDLTLGVTFAYWLLVVRRGRASMRSLLAVFIASAAATAVTLPPGHRALARDVRYLGIPFEFAVLGLIVVGVRRTRRRLAQSGVELDVPERIRLVLGGSSMRSRVADVMAMEASVFYYALASWRRKPFVPSGALSFSYHRRNGYVGLLYAVLGIALVETAAVDLVVRVRHPVAANILLALGLFGVVWVLGMARGVRLRPVVVTREELLVRSGILWHLDVPRAQIARVHTGRVSAPRKGTAGYLRGAPGTPNVLIELAAPLTAHGPYGAEKRVERIGLVIDDLAAFERAIATA